MSDDILGRYMCNQLFVDTFYKFFLLWSDFLLNSKNKVCKREIFEAPIDKREAFSFLSLCD